MLFSAFIILLNPLANAQWQAMNGLTGDSYSYIVAHNDTIFGYTDNIVKGLFSSSDFGQTWTIIDTNKIDYLMFFNDKIAGVINGRLYISQGGIRNLHIIDGYLHNTLTGYFLECYCISSNYIYIKDSYYGIYRTNDYGAHWEEVNAGLYNYRNIYRMFAKGTSVYAIDNSHHVYQYVNSNWVDLAGPNPFPSGYIYHMNKLDSTFLISNLFGIYTKNDHSPYWDSLPQQFINYNDSLKSISGIEIIGSRLYISVYGSGIYSTDNMGASWQCISDNLLDKHIQEMTVDNGNIYVSIRDLGVCYSRDNGLTWHSTSGNNNVMATEFGKLSGEVFCGSWAGQIYKLLNNEWMPTKVNSIAFSYSGVNDFTEFNNNFYAATGSGVLISRDLGNTWDDYYNGLFMLDNYGPSFNFFKKDSVLYLSSWKGVYLLDEQNNRWIRDYNIPFDTLHPDPNYEIKIAGHDSIICEATMHGIFYTQNNGLSWNMLTSNYIDSLCSLTINPHLSITEDHIIYLHVGQNSIFKSEDNGLSWTQINHGINDSAMVYSMTSSHNTVFLGTDYGIYLTANQGQNWYLVNDGLPGNKVIYSLNSFDDYIYSGIFYEKIYRRALTSFITKTITGNVYMDANDNGIKDNGEDNIRDIIVSMQPGNYYVNTDTTGNYFIQADILTDTVVLPYSLSYLHSNPASYYVPQTETGRDFGVYMTPDIRDLRINITNTGRLRLGQDTRYRISYVNNGSTTTNASIQYCFDTLLFYSNSSVNPSFQNSQLLEWQISGLLPFERGNIDVDFHVSNSLINSRNFISSVTILPINGDVTPLNNSDTLNQPLFYSSDPNDKEVKPIGNITPDQVSNSQEMMYTIRFQNTGNDTAFYVKIVDTISNKLYIPSFRVLSASHPCSYKISGKGVVTFTFLNINLPDSGHNQLLSNGFIKYAINCKTNLKLNDTIANNAYIYFDVNQPVLTNTMRTIIKEKEKPEVRVPDDEMLVYPNPSKEWLNVYFKNPGSETAIISIYNHQGSKIWTLQTKTGNIRLNTSRYAKSIYTIEIILSGNKMASKFVIQ